MTSTEEPVADTVYVQELFTNKKVEEPTRLVFSVNGDLVGEDLRWENWGSDVATATGSFVARNYEQGGSEIVTGGLVATDLRLCAGAGYYTRLRPSLPGSAPFQPRPATFDTPCDR